MKQLGAASAEAGVAVACGLPVARLGTAACCRPRCRLREVLAWSTTVATLAGAAEAAAVTAASGVVRTAAAVAFCCGLAPVNPGGKSLSQAGPAAADDDDAELAATAGRDLLPCLALGGGCLPGLVIETPALPVTAFGTDDLLLETGVLDAGKLSEASEGV